MKNRIFRSVEVSELDIIRERRIKACVLSDCLRDDEIDLFFKSMAISVKKLPAKGKTEAKLQILTLVSQLEQKYLEPTAQPAQVLFQIPSQQNHSLLSLLSSPSPC